MKTKKILKLNQTGKNVLLVFFIILVIIMIPFGIKIYKQNNLKSLSYDKQAVNSIMNKKAYKEVIDVGYSDTINNCVKTKSFNKENLKSYKKINYVKQKDFCTNINKLLDKKYTVKETNNITKNSTNDSLNEFVKKDYIENISSYLKYDYAKTKNIDRYIKYYNETRDSYDNIVIFVNIGLDNDFYTDTTTTDDYSDTVLVNKYCSVSEKYKPKKLRKIDKSFWVDNEEQYAADVAASAFEEMAKKAAEENIYILANSTYRSYEKQEEVFNTYKDLYGEKYALKYAAKPGFSEHQTGLVIDVASKTEDIFANSKEYPWMKENSYKYGFIQRYEKGKEDITGYKSEAWHYRYVGKKIAKYIHEHDITYEEYYYRFIDKEK